MSKPVPERTSVGGAWIHRIDLSIALLILVFCGWLFYLTTTFEQVSDLFAQDIQPSFFPRLILWVIMLLTLLLPFEQRLFKNGEQLARGRRKPIGLMAYYTFAVLALLVMTIPWLGTYLTLIMICLLLPILWGERRWRLVIPYALIFPTVVMLLFGQVLKVYFEPGLLGMDFR